MTRSKKKKYEKPILKKENTMKFPVEIIEESNRKIVCRQCSNCHGCR